MAREPGAIWAHEEEMEKRAGITHGPPDPSKRPDPTLWTPAEAIEVTRSGAPNAPGRADFLWDRERDTAPSPRTTSDAATPGHRNRHPAAPARSDAPRRPRAVVRRENQARARRRRLLLLLAAIVLLVMLVFVSELLA